MVLVALGSKNPIKREGVFRAFKKYFDHVIVVNVSVPSNVRPQPIGLKETILGAIYRAKHALEKIEDADYGVGVEAGFIPIPATITGYFDYQFAAIIDRERRVTLGSSQGFEFPVKAVDDVLSGKAVESEVVISEITGIKNIGDKMGAIGFLTREKVVRADLTEQAIISALIPRLNPKLYNKSWPLAEDVIRLLE